LTNLLNVTSLNLKKIAPGNLAEAYDKFGNNVNPLVEKIERLIKVALKPKANPVS
jgi:hypothetical protein